ncbi:MAG: dTDP-4-dehydrorhamnose 3,5-epimerase family protein [Bacteroidaceae bacterium]|nr:dTDP-4-dehydrorhamnose 3,5-epimerase family protein [Bacteroidaceae bacterium]
MFTYKVDNVYAPDAEASIAYNDKTLKIDWPITVDKISLSEKDKLASSFLEAIYFD